jgi:hypothetical protein
MFTATFIGHQGWLLGTSRTNILMDPLLEPEFGAAPESGLRVFPPRAIDHRLFPPISAVIISHEHDDHFQLRSLNRLDRRIPIFISDRSSWAAHRIVAEMGFAVRPLHPEATLSIGDLEIRAFCPDFLTHATPDEWDVLTYAVRDRNGDALFYSPVDVATPPQAVAAFEKHGHPNLVTYANNFSSRHPFKSWQPPPPGCLPVVTGLYKEFLPQLATGHQPELVLATGGGWYHTGELEWLNRCAFPADNEAIAKALHAGGMERFMPFVALEPGSAVVMEDGKKVAVRDQDAAYLRTLRREQWPDRSYAPSLEKAAELPPLPGNEAFQSGDLDRLRARLRELAQALVGSQLFLALHSLTAGQLSNYRRAYALALRSKRQDFIFEYAPAACDFLPVERDVREYAAGGVFWAADFLALAEGDVPAAALLFGRFAEFVNVRVPNPGVLSLETMLVRTFHPLRFPDRFYRSYVRRCRELPPDGPRIPAAVLG